MPPLAAAIIMLIVQYGIPGALQIIAAVNKDVITDADLEALKDIKPPSFYLNTEEVK